MINKEETLRTVLVCGTIGRIKELIRNYEAGTQEPFVIFEEIQKTLDYANEVYKKMTGKEED